MSFELLHFRESDKILKRKKMDKQVQSTLEYIDDALYGTLHRGELLRQALEEMDWRKEPLNVLDGRRYFYKGLRNGIALDGSLNTYEFILEGLLRLQVGFDKKRIEAGILLLNGQRSEKTPYGSTRELVEAEIRLLQPTINLPVSIVLFDLGKPGALVEEPPDKEETPIQPNPTKNRKKGGNANGRSKGKGAHVEAPVEGTEEVAPEHPEKEETEMSRKGGRPHVGNDNP